MNGKLHTETDAYGRPILTLPKAGRTSDYKDARTLLDALPKVKALVAERVLDAGWLRYASKYKDIDTCIPQQQARVENLRP